MKTVARSGGLNKMEEMKYSKDRDVRCLYEEFFGGWKIVILNLGTHPTAYIGMDDKENFFYQKSYDYLAGEYRLQGNDVNGGFTYSAFGVQDFYKNFWFLGWDYAHAGDYLGFMDNSGHKWTTEEILQQAREQIRELNLWVKKIE